MLINTKLPELQLVGLLYIIRSYVYVKVKTHDSGIICYIKKSHVTNSYERDQKIAVINGSRKCAEFITLL